MLLELLRVSRLLLLQKGCEVVIVTWGSNDEPPGPLGCNPCTMLYHKIVKSTCRCGGMCILVLWPIASYIVIWWWVVWWCDGVMLWRCEGVKVSCVCGTLPPSFNSLILEFYCSWFGLWFGLVSRISPLLHGYTAITTTPLWSFTFHLQYNHWLLTGCK